MERQEAYNREVTRLMNLDGVYIPRANAEMLAATKFWPTHCPHCGELNTAHHADCPTHRM